MPPGPSEPALIAEAQKLLGDPALRAAVQRHFLAGEAGAAAGPGVRLPMGIHPDDQMLRHSLHVHRDAWVAISQYFNVALQQFGAAEQIVRAAHGGRRDLAILDFACGYGRLLRFASRARPVDRLWAAEIMPEALAWVAGEYGVQPIASMPEPERFDAGRRFDVIWVASLFSHLPDGLFRRWIARLYGHLAPGGILCFSVHHESLLPEDMQVPEEGILFMPASENARLDGAIYGTTFVTHAYVERAIAEAVGAGRGHARIDRGLAHEQDIHVLCAAPGPALDALGAFRYGPWGWVEERGPAPGGRLRLKGWAGSLDGEALARVELRIGERRLSLERFDARPDVAAYFAGYDLGPTGFDFTTEFPVEEGTPVEVSAVARNGERALLYFGRVPAWGANAA